MEAEYFENVTAKKAMKCLWCGESIPKGEKHHQYYGEWEGEHQNWRMHPECRDAFLRETDNDGGTIDRYAHARGQTEDEMKYGNSSIPWSQRS